MQNIQNQLNQLVQTVKWLVENAKTGGSSEYRTKKDWKRSKKRKCQVQRGKETILNLSNKLLTDTDYILLGKGLSFCQKTRSHDTIKVAEETFNFSRRLRLKGILL